MSRVELPQVEEVSGGYTLRCQHCSFKRFSMNNPKAPAVHLCHDREAVKWEGTEIWGQKTVPVNPEYLAVLAKKAAAKGTRR